MTARPICNACSDEITDDYCVIMSQEDAFDTCFCRNCKNKMIIALSRISPYAAELWRDYLDEHEHRTPERVFYGIEEDSSSWHYQYS